MERVEDLEREILTALSYVPSADEVNRLSTEAAALAEVARASGERASPLLSRLAPAITHLIPPSLSPNDTILAQLGRQAAAAAGQAQSDPAFAIVPDKHMPLFNNSFGPNGVLFECEAPPFGPSRINLFWRSPEATAELLFAYLNFRDAREAEILSLFATGLESGDCDGSVEVERRDVAAMFRAAATLALQDPHRRIGEFGLSIASFCQTWTAAPAAGGGGGAGGGAGGGPTPRALFSVMSPHFQTKIVVADAEKLRAAVPEISERMLRSYCQALRRFKDAMVREGYAAAFVNLDQLASCLL